jgi:hypothetical protein
MTTPDLLEPADSKAIQSEWLRRTEAEYSSAVLTQHLTLWLMQLVAPFELTRAGLAIVEDELVHSELSHQVYIAAGGKQPVDLKAKRLGLADVPRAQLLEGVVRAGVESFCLGETVAVRLFSKLRAPCAQPEAKAALDRILRDEVRHKEFGWTLLEWLLTIPQSDQVRQLVDQELPAMFKRLRANYAYAQLHHEHKPVAARAAWGLMPPPDYAVTLDETLERDYTPLFGALDIDAARAWNALL